MKKSTKTILIVVAVIAIILIISNWTAIKAWFMPATNGSRFQSPGSAQRQKCQRVGNSYYYNNIPTTAADCAAHGAL